MNIGSDGGFGAVYPAAGSRIGDSAPASGSRGPSAGPVAAGAPSGPNDLTADERREVSKLQARDREVRQHEQAHVAAGRDLVLSGPTYTYTTGPDGRRYAVGGEVQIDTSPESTPEETIEKAERIVRAALAPAEPSGQDRQVAAQARGMAAEARVQLARERYAQTESDESDSPFQDLDRLIA